MAHPEATYFRWHAHDDLIEPTYLADCVAALDAKPAAVLVQPRVRVINHDGSEREIVRPFGPEMADPDPIERFRARVRNRWCLEIFGLIRTSALRDSVLIDGYIGMDRTLLLELALRGQFVLLDNATFLNREHPGRCTHITRLRDRHALEVTYDAANEFRPGLSTWRFYLGQRSG